MGIVGSCTYSKGKAVVRLNNVRAFTVIRSVYYNCARCARNADADRITDGYVYDILVSYKIVNVDSVTEAVDIVRALGEINALTLLP